MLPAMGVPAEGGEVLLAALCPAEGQIRSDWRARPVGRVFRALIKSHDDVGAKGHCTSIECSGEKKWEEPSRWERNCTPSSLTLRRSFRLKT